MTIKSAPADQVFERGADNARLAALHGRHGVEQMREAAHAGVERSPRRRVVGAAVITGNDDAALDQTADCLRADALEARRDQRAATAQRRSRGNVAALRDSKFCRIVDSAAFRGEIGALEVDAEHARYAGTDGLDATRGDCRARQRRRRPSSASAGIVVPRPGMRRAYAPDRIDARRVVEQHAAAAVIMAVDETRNEAGAMQIMHVGAADARVRCLGSAADAAAVDEDSMPGEKAVAGEDAGDDEDASVFTVSVTLRRLRRAQSGLRPRRSACGRGAIETERSSRSAYMQGVCTSPPTRKTLRCFRSLPAIHTRAPRSANSRARSSASRSDAVVVLRQEQHRKPGPTIAIGPCLPSAALNRLGVQSAGFLELRAAA